MQSTSSDTTSAAPRRRLKLGLDRFSGLYVWALLVVAFSLWIPHLFLRVSTLQQVLTFQSIGVILALGLLVPVAAGAFDLTIAATLTVSSCFTAWALVQGYSAVVAIAGALLLGLAVGFVNGLVVEHFKIDSFIGTLGISSVLAAVAYMIVSGSQIVLGVADYRWFLDIARQDWFGLPASVYYAAVLALVLFWITEYTPVGRYLYSVGGNPVAARLAGVRVGRVVFGAFMVSGLISAFAGVIYVATVGTASPQGGLGYLLPSFSAVFLGATQIRPGRVNVLGTLVAILLLATGVTGLQLAGAPGYVTDLFNGLALVFAMGLAARSARRRS